MVLTYYDLFPLYRGKLRVCKEVLAEPLANETMAQGSGVYTLQLENLGSNAGSASETLRKLFNFSVP